MFSYSLLQNGEVMAVVHAPTREQAQQEIMRYALAYLEDGDVEIHEAKGGK